VPPYMTEIQSEIFAGGSKEKLLKWLSLCTRQVKRRNATGIVEFKAAAAKALRIAVTGIGPMLTKVGIDIKGQTNSQGDKVAYGRVQREPGSQLDGADDGLQVLPQEQWPDL